MFEARIVSLGRYKVLKTEDIGHVHPQGKYTAPDFRVVLKDDSQWLVEVKNVYDANPVRQRFRIGEPYLGKLAGYASVMKCQLKLALFWATAGPWPPTTPRPPNPPDGEHTPHLFTTPPAT